jgi:magnesium-transporting ATPase (P-type)
MAEKVETTDPNSWHALEIVAVFNQVQGQPQGLTQEESQGRLATYGPNRLRPPKKRSPWVLFLGQFKNILIYVLVAAALVTTLLGHWADAGVIFGVVFLNALIGFIQEGKAERALDAIRNLLSPQATVLRDGQRISVPADQLVPGDAVFLQSGDKVPADLRLFKVKNLRIDEDSLTGESVPVDKLIAPVQEAVTIGDRTCMAFSGTMVTSGQGTGVVVATGDRTELGRINTLLASAETLTTRLLQKMAEFGRWLTFAIIGLAAATFAFGILGISKTHQLD